MLRLQYISDLHLEHYKINTEKQLEPERWLEPDPTADALVLAGDIGWPNKPAYGLFMQWCSQNWKHVYVVAGNHEYYNELNQTQYSRAEKLELLELIARSLPNVTFLQQRRVEIRPGVWILGCTLWTDIPDTMQKYVNESLNDFRMIQGATFDEYKEWHRADREWVFRELKEVSSRGEKAIVVTHHLPTPKLIHKKYAFHPLNCCFATDLEDRIEDCAAPLAWICGHSHTGARLRIGSTEMALNPYGYPGETVDTRRKQAVLEIPISPSS